MYLFPIKENRIVIDNFGGKGYGDSTKYIAEGLIGKNCQYDIIWLVDNLASYSFPPQIKPVKIDSLQALYMRATAKVWIDNVRHLHPVRKKKQQIYLQAWHAPFGPKKAEADAEAELGEKYVKEAKYDGQIADGIISNSKLLDNQFRRAFWLSKNVEILKFGLPRNDFLAQRIGDVEEYKHFREKFKFDNESLYVLYTLRYKNYDDRFSHSNKEWAEQVGTPENNADRMTFRTDWVVDSHPAILDGFVTMFREELEAQKEQEQPFVKQFYVVENLQAAPLKIERFGNLDDAMSQYQALPNHYMKALGVEKNPNPLPGSLDILQCKNGLDTIVEDYKTVPGWDNPYIQNHVVQPLQGALAVQDVELAYELPDAYFHIQTFEDGFDYTLYNKDFTERDGGILETDGDKSVQEAMTELLAEFGCDAAQGRIMDAAELREQADMVAEQQAEVLKEKLAAERPAPEETLSFYVAECLEFTFAGEFHDHLTMEEALEAYDKIPSERMNADKCIGFCIEEDGGFVGMYELVVNDKVQRENINSINYFRDDKLVQQAISDMEKLMAARQQSKEQERSNTKKSVLDALRSLKTKKQEQAAQEQPKPQKGKKRGDIEL